MCHASFAPNPVGCVWKGPHVSDLDCATCALGYETTNATNTTCFQPEFRPYKGWAADLSRAPLQLQGKDGANTTTLEAGRTYTIAAPALDPKETKFAGYAQPFTKIRYKLDFSRGAEVDIGCGTTVIGDGRGDNNVAKDEAGLRLPSSMHAWSFQWPIMRVGNLKATPPQYGFFPQR